MQAVSVASILSIPFITHVDRKRSLNYALTFSLLRYGLFDMAYNKTRGLPINYIGSTSTQDRIMNKFSAKSIFLSKVASIGLSIHLNNKINKNDKRKSN